MDVRRAASIDEVYFGRGADTKGKIRWYVAPIGAKVFEQPTVFRSRDWIDLKGWIDPRPGIDLDTPSKWYNGRTPNGVSGQGPPCGDPSWWIDGIPSPPPLPSPRNSDGLISCCSVGGLQIGGASLDQPISGGGMSIGGSLHFLAGGGLSIGGEALVYLTSPGGLVIDGAGLAPADLAGGLVIDGAGLAPADLAGGLAIDGAGLAPADLAGGLAIDGAGLAPEDLAGGLVIDGAGGMYGTSPGGLAIDGPGLAPEDLAGGLAIDGPGLAPEDLAGGLAIDGGGISPADLAGGLLADGAALVPSGPTVANLGAQIGTVAASTLTKTGVTVATGDFLVVRVAYSGAGASVFGGVTWNGIAMTLCGPLGASSPGSKIFGLKVTSGATANVVASMSFGNNLMVLTCASIHGLVTGSLDGTNYATSGGVGTTPDSGSTTGSSSTSVIMCAVALSGSTETGTWISPYVNGQGGSTTVGTGDVSLTDSYLIVNPPAMGSYRSKKTGEPSVGWNASVACFK